ncbi:hypothetical protein, partial [Stenotrophomonas maltophilia]|uniref:hypothetical protein n=1 Tax=Stenotrophomonas maltophilia TaxID=40324 RepID=UPI001954DE00
GRDFVPTLGVALGFGVRPENAQFASERIVAPLNAQIERLTTARAGLGWRFVGGIMDRSRREKRGYCGEMGQSWFRTYE